MKNPEILFNLHPEDELLRVQLLLATKYVYDVIGTLSFSEIISDKSLETLGYYLDFNFFFSVIKLIFPNLSEVQVQQLIESDDLFIFIYDIETRFITLHYDAVSKLSQNPNLIEYMAEYYVFLQEHKIPSASDRSPVNGGFFSGYTYKQLFVICSASFFVLRTLYNYLYDKYYTTNTDKEISKDDTDTLSSVYEVFFMDLDLLTLLFIQYTMILGILLFFFKIRRNYKNRFS